MAALEGSVYASGMMGAAVAARLVERGARVKTCLSGRSQSSVERAKAAGMTDVAFDDLADADFVLSIVPPGEAVAFARELAPKLGASARRPIFVDCNAVAPTTVTEIAEIVSAAGGRVVDAGIIGGPPEDGYDGPVFYASGPEEETAAFAGLEAFGLRVHVMSGGIGAASAMKMSYAGISKGFTAIAAAMIMAAQRGGLAEPLFAELGETQPEFLVWLTRQLPKMPPKAYRWVAEMEEIASFNGDEDAGREIYQAIANFYRKVAERPEATADHLTDFLAQKSKTS